VVRTPKRWERIVEIAGDHRYELPANPDSKALEEFLIHEKPQMHSASPTCLWQ